MLGNQITLFKLLGFDIKVDLSWLFLAVLVTWTLSDNLFPALYEGHDAATYWRMGIIGALGLFASIILHELAHSVVARRYGIPIRGITLFIFGGVAEMGGEPPSAKAEFRMAIAGPIASLMLAILFHWANVLGASLGFGEPISGVLLYLSSINALLALFNLIPAFPLDGGRALRAFLWSRKKDIKHATKISTKIGGAFGFALMVVGFISLIQGNIIGGVWWFLIGMFLRNAANASYMQVVAKSTFGSEPISRFMTPDPETVTPWISVETLIQEHIFRSHHQCYPVVDDGKLIGFVNTRDVRNLPADERINTPVGRIMQPITPDTAISPDFEAIEALSLMNRTSNSRLLVVASGHLVGIVTLKDLIGFLSIRLDLEGPDV